MREELLADLARVGGRLGELRLDTELDVAHGVVRYLELLKLAALIERPPSQSIAASLPDINARLLAASTSLEGEILQSSTLDESLLALEHDRQAAVIRAGDRRRGPRGTLAGPVPAPQRRGARAVGLGRRDVLELPAALQVRAGLSHPEPSRP